MTTLVEIEAFLSRALDQRGKHGDTQPTSRHPIASALRLAERRRARVVIKPFFAPAYLIDSDIIIIPPQPFRLVRRPKLLASYILHELVHWSGAAARLNRLVSAHRFDAAYTREELVAEIGAVLLSFDLGITRRPILPNHRYLSNYLAGIERPDVALRVALGQAELAASYIKMMGRAA